MVRHSTKKGGVDVGEVYEPHPAVLEALRGVAEKVALSYINGQKSAARARLRQLPSTRQAYVIMCLGVLLDPSDYRALVRSITY